MLSFGNHPLLLIEDRQAGVGQLVIRCHFDEPFADFNRFVKFFLVRIGHG